MTEFDRARRRTEARLAKIARMAAHGVYQGKARLLHKSGASVEGCTAGFQPTGAGSIPAARTNSL